MTIEEELKLVADAAAMFPAEFGLRGFPGKKFRVNLNNSYVSTGTATVQLYTDIWVCDRWLDFAKGTIEELTKEVVNS